MAEVNEFVVVKVGDKWCAPCGCGISFLTDNTAEAAASKTIARWGGEWDCTPDGTGFRYRRKPQSDAERVARELWRLGRTVRVEEAEFVREATELIATVNAAELAEVRSKWSEETARAEAASWEHSKAKARVQELEAELDSPLARRSLESECSRLRKRIADNDDFMAFLASELDKWKCGKPAAEVAPMFWPEKIACIVKERTKELEAQVERLEDAIEQRRGAVERDRDLWRRKADEMRDRADAYRAAWERLRDAVREQNGTFDGIVYVLRCIGLDRLHPLNHWALAHLPRLEAALQEPEVQNAA